VRLAAKVLPPLIALVGTGFALVAVFPRDTGDAVVVAGLFWAGVGGAMLSRRLAPPIQRIEGADPAGRMYDEESRLGNRLYLRDILSREIARNLRHGTRSTLVVFETRLVGQDDATVDAGNQAKAAAAFTGKTLREEARGTDYVARLDQNRYAALLAATDRGGARVFAERFTKQLGSKPFGRSADGRGVFIRAIGTAVEWRQDLATPDAFLSEANDRVDTLSTRVHQARRQAAEPLRRGA
jgi:GGDEF domain-containing protein